VKYGNKVVTLDLILSHNEQISEQLVSKVAVQSVCFSELLDCHCRSLSQRHKPTGRCARSTRQPSAPTFCSPGGLVSSSWTLTAVLICSTPRSSESRTSMCRYRQVVVAVASTTAATYRTKHAKPSSVGDSNIRTTL